MNRASSNVLRLSSDDHLEYTFAFSLEVDNTNSMKIVGTRPSISLYTAAEYYRRRVCGATVGNGMSSDRAEEGKEQRCTVDAFFVCGRQAEVLIGTKQQDRGSR